MKPFSIVIHLDVVEDVFLGLVSRLQAFIVNGFDLEAVIPAFHGRVIVAIAFLAHAANQLVSFEQRLTGRRTNIGFRDLNGR